MTEEVKVTNEENKNENKCFCQNKAFRKFLVIALGTFVGVYGALTLFAATHRPPMMPPCAGFRGFNPPPVVMMQCPCRHKHHFGKFQKFDKKQFNHADRNQKGAPAPFDSQKADD